MNPISKNGLLLALFGLVCTGIVTLTYVMTKPAIEAAELRNKYAVLNQIIPDELHDNALAEHCIQVQDDHLLGSREPHQAYLATLQGKPSAIAIETTAPNGYSGRIELVVGLNLEGVITGVRILSHKETPGLGDKIEKRKSDWVDSFIDQVVHSVKDKAWAVQKDGGRFDQFTGATITPRAVVAAVKRTALFYQANRAELFERFPACVGESNE